MQGARATELFTVGHGTMSSDAFTALVRSASIELIFDVRSVPGSRRHPHFARAELEDWLVSAGVGYAWKPRLGGFRRPRPDSTNVSLRHPSFRGFADYMAEAEFRAALAEVKAEAADVRTAIMCAEMLWWRCHRRLISDAAELLLGMHVSHLGHDGRLAEHRLTEGVRVAEAGLVYDAGQERLSEQLFTKPRTGPNLGEASFD